MNDERAQVIERLGDVLWTHLARRWLGERAGDVRRMDRRIAMRVVYEEAVEHKRALDERVTLLTALVDVYDRMLVHVYRHPEGIR